MCLSIEINRPDCILSKGEHVSYEWITTHNGMGYRCGYVRIPKGHPWHGIEEPENIEVHGGITFAEPDVPCDKGGEDNAWWLGFDCAHAWDKPDPSLPNSSRTVEMHMEYSGTIRTQEFVENECRKLCEQAMEATKSRS